MALFAVDGTRAGLAVRFASGPAAAAVSPLSMRLGDRLTGWVGANLRSMRNGDGRLDLPGLTAPLARWASATPLVADGALAGVLTVYSGEPLGDDQCRMLEMIGPHLAAAVASAAAAEAEVPRVHAPLRVVARRQARG